MSDEESGRALNWQRRKRRREWIAKFAEQQRIAKRWIAFVDLVDWCAQSTTTASLDAQAKAREVAYQRLADSVQKGEFECGRRSKILYLDTLLTSEGRSPRCRLTREQFEIASDAAATPPAPSLPLTVLNCCWLPRDLARQWLESHGYHWSPRFEPPKTPTASEIDEIDLQLGWVPVTAALEIIKTASGDPAWEQLKRAIRLKSLPARCRADGISRYLEPHWLDFLVYDNPEDDCLSFDRQKAAQAKLHVPDLAADVVVSIARCAELWPDCTWSNLSAEKPAADNVRSEREFRSPDWSLGNVLSWIAFRDPALIWRIEGRHDLLTYRRYPRTRNPKRPMLDPRADQTLLDVLKDGGLTAIRNGAEIASTHWFGKYPSHLSIDLRFRRIEVIKCWPADGGVGAPVLATSPGAHTKPSGDKPARRPPSREKKFWPEARAVAFQWLIDNGCPAPADGNQAELERYVIKYLEDHGHQASEPTVRRHVVLWIKERRDELNA